MKLRLSLAARLALVVMIALVAVWIVTIAQFYRSHDGQTDRFYPEPRQIIALVQLVEAAAPDQVPSILDAVTTSTLIATISPDPVLGPDSADIDTGLRQRYASALQGRSFALSVPPAPTRRRRLMRLFRVVHKALEFRIALRTGQTLVIDTESPLLLSRAGLPIGLGAGLFGTLVALVALIALLRETRPLARLAAAVDRIDPAGGPVALPAAPRSAPEIQALVGAFDRLQTRVSQLLRARMAMLGGISHDVRTFATRLRLRIDLIPDPAERDRASADIGDMIRLLDDALLASRAGAGELTEELVELAELVSAEVDDRRAAGAAISFHATAAALDAPVLGDRLALRRIVANLADNALKYGHSARLDLYSDTAGVILSVDDDGPGIPQTQRDLLLEPFVRLEASRSRHTGGAGLGLAIVRNLVEAHGGTVAIGDAPGGGARITVRLPLFRPG